MLWKPITDGESVFLAIHKAVSHPLKLQTDSGLEHLVSAALLQEYVRLAASLEVTYRTIRDATTWYAADNNISAKSVGRQLRTQMGLPPELYQDSRFLEVVRASARVVHEDRQVSKSLGRDLYEKDGLHCYICGRQLQTTTPNEPDFRSADHLWPLSLGGATILENLMPACRSCNSDRGHLVTWGVAAIGTFQRDARGIPFSKNWRFAWAGATLMAAAKKSSGRLLTLKAAAKEAEPLMSGAKVPKDQWFAYFETHQMIGV